MGIWDCRGSPHTVLVTGAVSGPCPISATVSHGCHHAQPSAPHQVPALFKTIFRSLEIFSVIPGGPWGTIVGGPSPVLLLLPRDILREMSGASGSGLEWEKPQVRAQPSGIFCFPALPPPHSALSASPALGELLLWAALDLSSWQQDVIRGKQLRFHLTVKISTRGGGDQAARTLRAAWLKYPRNKPHEDVKPREQQAVAGNRSRCFVGGTRGQQLLF